MPAASSHSLAVQRSTTTSREDLQRGLKSVLEQNALLQSQLDAANKQLQSSESKRKYTAASLQASQAKTRKSLKGGLPAQQISLALEQTELVVQEKMEQQKRKHQVSSVFVLILFLDSLL